MTMDAMMIAYYLGLKETGVYTTIIYLTSALQIPYKSLMRVSTPLIPQYWKEKSMEKMSQLYQKVSSISLIVGLFMFLLIWTSRAELFSFLPSEYLLGIWVFLFLMIGRIIDMYFGLNGWIFVTSKKYKYDIFFTFILLFLVLILNVFLIPRYGIIGAAISTGFALIVYNFARMLFVFFVYKIHPFHWNQLKIACLFGLILLATEFVSKIFVNRYLEIGLNFSFVSIVFLGAIFFFDLEPEINSYLKKGKIYLQSKFKK
jgi:O-antigen/teichoic acid export membrane protein